MSNTQSPCTPLSGRAICAENIFQSAKNLRQLLVDELRNSNLSPPQTTRNQNTAMYQHTNKCRTPGSVKAQKRNNADSSQENYYTNTPNLPSMKIQFENKINKTCSQIESSIEPHLNLQQKLLQEGYFKLSPNNKKKFACLPLSPSGRKIYLPECMEGCKKSVRDSYVAYSPVNNISCNLTPTTNENTAFGACTQNVNNCPNEPLKPAQKAENNAKLIQKLALQYLIKHYLESKVKTGQESKMQEQITGKCKSVSSDEGILKCNKRQVRYKPYEWKPDRYANQPFHVQSRHNLVSFRQHPCPTQKPTSPSPQPPTEPACLFSIKPPRPILSNKNKALLFPCPHPQPPNYSPCQMQKQQSTSNQNTPQSLKPYPHLLEKPKQQVLAKENSAFNNMVDRMTAARYSRIKQMHDLKEKYNLNYKPTSNLQSICQMSSSLHPNRDVDMKSTSYNTPNKFQPLNLNKKNCAPFSTVPTNNIQNKNWNANENDEDFLENDMQTKLICNGNVGLKRLHERTRKGLKRKRYSHKMKRVSTYLKRYCQSAQKIHSDNKKKLNKFEILQSNNEETLMNSPTSANSLDKQYVDIMNNNDLKSIRTDRVYSLSARLHNSDNKINFKVRKVKNDSNTLNQKQYQRSTVRSISCDGSSSLNTSQSISFSVRPSRKKKSKQEGQENQESDSLIVNNILIPKLDLSFLESSDRHNLVPQPKFSCIESQLQNSKSSKSMTSSQETSSIPASFLQMMGAGDNNCGHFENAIIKNTTHMQTDDFEKTTDCHSLCSLHKQTLSQKDAQQNYHFSSRTTLLSKPTRESDKKQQEGGRGGEEGEEGRKEKGKGKTERRDGKREVGEEEGEGGGRGRREGGFRKFKEYLLNDDIELEGQESLKGSTMSNPKFVKKLFSKLNNLPLEKANDNIITHNNLKKNFQSLRKMCRSLLNSQLNNSSNNYSFANNGFDSHNNIHQQMSHLNPNGVNVDQLKFINEQQKMLDDSLVQQKLPFQPQLPLQPQISLQHHTDQLYQQENEENSQTNQQCQQQNKGNVGKHRNHQLEGDYQMQEFQQNSQHYEQNFQEIQQNAHDFQQISHEFEQNSQEFEQNSQHYEQNFQEFQQNLQHYQQNSEHYPQFYNTQQQERLSAFALNTYQHLQEEYNFQDETPELLNQQNYLPMQQNNNKKYPHKQQNYRQIQQNQNNYQQNIHKNYPQNSQDRDYSQERIPSSLPPLNINYISHTHQPATQFQHHIHQPATQFSQQAQLNTNFQQETQQFNTNFTHHTNQPASQFRLSTHQPKTCERHFNRDLVEAYGQFNGSYTPFDDNYEEESVEWSDDVIPPQQLNYNQNNNTKFQNCAQKWIKKARKRKEAKFESKKIPKSRKNEQNVVKKNQKKIKKTKNLKQKSVGMKGKKRCLYYDAQNDLKYNIYETKLMLRDFIKEFD